MQRGYTKQIRLFFCTWTILKRQLDRNRCFDDPRRGQEKPQIITLRLLSSKRFTLCDIRHAEFYEYMVYTVFRKSENKSSFRDTRRGEPSSPDMGLAGCPETIKD